MKRRHRNAFLNAFLLVATLVLSAGGSGDARAQETGTLEGEVRTASAAVPRGASAKIPGLGRATEVAATGTFRLSGLPAGEHVLLVESPTEGRAVETVTVRSGETTRVEIVLKLASHFEEVIVSGGLGARGPLDLATAATVLSGNELQLRAQASLGETLEQQAGVSSTFFGPGASRPIVRGQAGDRIRILEGGIGTGDLSAISPDHAVATEPLQAEQIEVLRGPATLLYGSSAIGGAINVVDQRIPTYRAGSPISGVAQLGGASSAGEGVAQLALDGGGDVWAWSAGASARDAGDYRAATGTVDGSALETEAARLGGTRFFGDAGFVGLALSTLDSLYGIPQAGEDPDHGERDAHGSTRIDSRQRRVDLQLERHRGLGIFRGAKLRAGTNDYEHAELEGDEVGTRFFNDVSEARLELVQKVRGPLSGSLGAQWSERTVEAVGEEAIVPRTEQSRIAAFAFEELEHGAVRWQLGARWERQRARPDRSVGNAVVHSGLSASAGVIWDLSRSWSLASSLARSVKLPAPEELYSQGPHAATSTFEIGDPSLRRETALGFDLGVRKTAGRLTGELALFHTRFDDYIFLELTGAELEGLPVGRYTRADARFSGAELTARIELVSRERRHLHLQLTGDTVTAELRSGADLPRTPPARLAAGLHYHQGPLNASLEARHVFEQTRVAPGESPTAGYTLWNASVGYRLLVGERIVDLLVRGRNLTDRLALSHTSFLKDEAPLPGRDVSASVRLWF